MRHLTSEGLNGRGMASTRRPRSWVQYSNTRKMLQDGNPSLWQVVSSFSLSELISFKLAYSTLFNVSPRMFKCAS